MADEGQGQTAEGTGAQAQAVPYTRFRTVVQARNDLQGRVTELEAQLQAATERAATADTLAAQVREAQAAAAAAEARFGTYKAISSHGIVDPDIVEAVEWAYGRLPAEGRPALGDALAAWRSDPTTAPAILRPHLLAPVQTQAQEAAPVQPQAQQAATVQATAPVTAPRVAPPAANAGVRPAPGGVGAASSYSPEAISRMTPQEYRAQRDAILKAAGGR